VKILTNFSSVEAPRITARSFLFREEIGDRSEELRSEEFRKRKTENGKRKTFN